MKNVDFHEVDVVVAKPMSLEAVLQDFSSALNAGQGMERVQIFCPALQFSRLQNTPVQIQTAKQRMEFVRELGSFHRLAAAEFGWASQND